MRSKSVEMLVDRCFWALVLVLPVLAYLILSVNYPTDFITVLSQFNVNTSNVIYSGLVQVFGTGGNLPFLDTTSTNSLVLYMSYMVLLELIHIFVDVILYIPRIAVMLLDRAAEMGDSKRW